MSVWSLNPARRTKEDYEDTAGLNRRMSPIIFPVRATPGSTIDYQRPSEKLLPRRTTRQSAPGPPTKGNRTLELKKPCRNSRAQPQAKPRQWTETKDATTLRHHELHRLPATSITIRYLELRKGLSLSTHT